MSSSFTYTMLILASLIAMSYGQENYCLTGCFSCNATGYCLQCEEGYILASGMCYTSSTSCFGGCDLCYYNPSETCQSCGSGYYVSDPTCSGEDFIQGCANWSPCSLDWWVWLIIGLFGCLVLYSAYKRCTARRTYSASLVTVCPTCKGGKYFQIQNDVVAIREDCLRCKGTGYI